MLKLDVYFYSPEVSLKKMCDLLKLRFAHNDQPLRNRLICAVLEGFELWQFLYQGKNIDSSEMG